MTWYFFFLVSLLYCFIYWSGEIWYDFWGATAQAHVVGFEDVYNSDGLRCKMIQVDFEYFDIGSKTVSRARYYLGWNATMPAVGEKFGIRYIPKSPDSAEQPDDSLSGPLWATLPSLFLWGLRALSIRRGEWKPIEQLYSEMHPSSWAYKSLT